MTIKQLHDGSDDGVKFGQGVTDKLSFYGVTTVDQPASASQAVFTVTATTALATATISAANTSVVFGFASSTVANAYVARVKQMQVDVEGLGVLLTAIRAALVSTGAMKGAA